MILIDQMEALRSKISLKARDTVTTGIAAATGLIISYQMFMGLEITQRYLPNFNPIPTADLVKLLGAMGASSAWLLGEPKPIKSNKNSDDPDAPEPVDPDKAPVEPE